MQDNSQREQSVRFETTITNGDQRVGVWRNDLAATSMSVGDLIDWQTAIDKGHPVKPGIKKDINGSSGVDNCGEFELFYLDIDGSERLTLEGAKRNDFFKCNAAFLYTTRHHQKPKPTKREILPACDRLRVATILPKTVYQKELIELLNIICVNLFDHDESCVEVSKIYLGNPGASKHIFDTNNRLNIKELFRLLLKDEKALEKTINSFVFRRLESEFDYQSIFAEFGLTDGEMTKVMILVAQYQSLAAEFRLHSVLDSNKPWLLQKYRGFQFERLPEFCELCRPENIFDSDHPELMGIVSALSRIVGGKSFLVDNINAQTRDFNPKKRGRDHYLKTYNDVQKKQYYPWSCRSFCRFYDRCEIAKQNPNCNILHAQPTRVHQVKQIKDYYSSDNFKTIQEMRKELKRILLDIIRNPDQKFHVLKVPCGIGKSHILKALSRLLKKCIIAVARHNLFDGFYGEKYGPLPPILEKLIIGDRLLGFGWRDSLKAKLADGNLTSEEILALEEYEAMEKRCAESEKKIITHERLLRGNTDLVNNVDIVFIDEDISSALFPGVFVSANFILKITRFQTDNEDALYVLGFLKELLNASQGSVVERPPDLVSHMGGFTTFLRRNAHKIHSAENILTFLRGDKFYIEQHEINSMHRRNLPEGPTIIELSATPNEMVLRQCYGDRVIIHDLGKVKPHSNSNLIQFHGKSLSASAIFKGADAEKNIELVKTIRKRYPGFVFISHKALRNVEEFKDLIADTDPWFCATEGLNSEASKKLIVVGTKNPPPSYLKLLAACLGLNHESINGYSPRISKTIVRNEYFEFTMMALSADPFIQKLQMHFTESILLQAVGRARYYNQGSIVFVYADYPLPEFKQLRYDRDLYENED